MMTKVILLLIGLYLSYYTWRYARITWKNGNKTAGALIMLLAAVFLPLAILLDLK